MGASGLWPSRKRRASAGRAGTGRHGLAGTAREREATATSRHIPGKSESSDDHHIAKTGRGVRLPFRGRTEARSTDFLDRIGGVSRSGQRDNRRPRGVYVIMGAVVVAAVVVTIVYSDHPLVDRFGANFATEALGILVTLVFVHRFLEQQERARRLRGSIGALRKGNRALSRLVEPWAALIKGSRTEFPSGPPQTIDEIFASHMTEGLLDLDPRRDREDEGAGERWLRWATGHFEEAKQSLETIIASYGSVLDPAYVEAIDELVDDPFLRLIDDLSRDDTLGPKQWRLKLNLARAGREAHFERLQVAVALHNRLSAEAASVRSRRTAPRSGTIGVELPLDWDLRVQSPAEPSWWRSPPTPGSLREQPAVR